MPGPAGGTGWRRPARRTREAGLHRAFGSRERGKKSGSPSGQWVTAPGKGGGSVRSEIFGAQERESPCSRRPSPPPPPGSHLKPALGHSVHVPPHGAGGCGRGRALRRAECKDWGPGAGPGVPGRGGGRGTAGRGRRRGGETSRLRPGLLHLPQSRRRRRLLVASSSLPSASTSTQNKNTPHLPATPLLIGQNRPGLGTPWGGEEEERAAAAARDHPSPTPGRSPRRSAREQPERGGGGGASPLLPPKHASPPREGEAGKCLSICVYLCMGGAVGRA